MSSKASGYASLQPHTAHVSRARIQKTWRPLPQPTQERVKQLLLSLQKDEQAVGEVVDKLIRRIPRMPFPRQHNKNKSTPADGSSYEADFDFEATLDRIQRLEAELAETMEASKLLREHIRREEAAAAADREEYKVLEAGARSEQSLAREQARKLHPIARAVDMDAEAHTDDGMESFEYDYGRGQEGEDYGEGRTDSAARKWTARARQQKVRAGGLNKSEIEQDEQLKRLVAQLRRHVNSIARNTAGLARVSDALDDAEQARGLELDSCKRASFKRASSSEHLQVNIFKRASSSEHLQVNIFKRASFKRASFKRASFKRASFKQASSSEHLSSEHLQVSIFK
ncbi:hypothetical protein DV737_g4110, partial [Chaetothyriales sp. CBS 132003]